MSAAPFGVPVIDISPYVAEGTSAERAGVARAMDAACVTVGFVQILGHGIPDLVIDGLKAGIDGFFALPLEDKMRSQASDFPGAGLAGDAYPENVWPEPASFRPGVEAYFAEAGRVARTLTRVFADALGMPADYFAPFTDHSLDVMRMNNYALPEGKVHLDGELTGMGEHTDFGIVTVLWADQVAGLQVVGPDGAWHDVAPIDGALLVNLGDITARWTNDRWRSTLHRVKPPIIDGTIRRRRSAAFFHDGNADAVVRAIPTCVPGGTEPKYPPLTVIENINVRLAGSRKGRLNATAATETERIRAAAATGAE